ncbi:riboflavin synthase subunit alpha [Thalassotalea fusca]
MFTGIVQTQANVISVNNRNNFSQIVVAVNTSWAGALSLGASIAINGVCLTVVRYEPQQEETFITFDVIDETLAVTNLCELDVGMNVNFERSLKIGDEIGGHQVSGHVHTVALLDEKVQSTDNCQLVFGCDKQWMKYILPKGFITINGVSLTVGAVTDGGFTVHLIPETLARTNLSALNNGDKVNLEFDQQTMTIVKTLERMKEQALI